MAAAENAGELGFIVTLLSAAVIAVPLFKRLGLGTVLGYLAAGLAIGPFGLKLLNNSESIIHIAELGVVMFLFIIGLEMKPSHLWGLRRQIFGLGSLQVVVCAILLTFVGMGFGFAWQYSFVGAAGFVLTSTAIVMQVLSEQQELADSKGQKIVSILLFEDLLIVPLLAVVAFLAPIDPNHSKADSSLWQQIGLSALTLSILIAAGLWLLNPLFKILAKSKIREVMTAAALLVVLGAALLMELGGLSMAMGAFLAGVLLSESSFRHQLEADIEPFRGLLLGLFFLGVGMSLNLRVVADNWQLVIFGVLALMLVKALCIYCVARLTKTSHADALHRAFLMAQGGEFAFVLFAAAAAQGVIDQTMHANMTATVVLSMALTPLFLIIYQKAVLPRLQQSEPQADDIINEQSPILIIGIGRFGQIINDLLLNCGYKTTVIDLDPTLIAGLGRYGVKSYFGDASRYELLLTAGLEEAKLLVLAIDNREQAVQITEFAKRTNPDITIIARAYDRIHYYRLSRAGANIAVRETFDSAINTAKRTLETLGMDKELVETIGTHYATRTEQTVEVMGEYFNPDFKMFTNQQMMKIAKAEDQKLYDELQQILHNAGFKP